MFGKIILLALALMVVVTVSASATTWDAYSGWTQRWINPAQQDLNAPWYILASTMDSGGAFVTPNYNAYYADGSSPVWNETISATQGHGWGEQYWSPSIFKNTGADTTVHPREWRYEGDWSGSESASAPAGSLILCANGGYITQNKVAMRWKAVADGTYTVTATFTGACTTGTNAGVRFDVNGATQWTDSITAYQQAKTYTHTFTLTAGQSLDAVVTGQDAVMLNYTISDAPANTPEPGSMLALASGLVGLVGFGIRRRK